LHSSSDIAANADRAVFHQQSISGLTQLTAAAVAALYRKMCGTAASGKAVDPASSEGASLLE
jgi:hypothetical protein